MRISFDLDDVLFVSPKTYETEPAPRFPYDRLFPERLRKGTPELIHTLQERGFEVWIYTSSFRSERYQNVICGGCFGYTASTSTKSSTASGTKKRFSATGKSGCP